MKKTFEGYVSRDEEYGYMGVNCTDVADYVNGMIHGFEGEKIIVTVTIEKMKNEEESYCEDCEENPCDCG